MQVNSSLQEISLNHSKMVTTRRKKAKAKKDTARVAKHAKKLKKQDARAAGADAGSDTITLTAPSRALIGARVD